MLNKKMLGWMGMSMLAVSSLPAATLQADAAGDAQAVNGAVKQFYVALNSMFTGDAAPMEAVWSHTDDVVYMGPGGEYLVGWAPVRDVWRQVAALKLGGKVEPSGLQITLGQDIAIVSLTEMGENTNTKMETQHVSIRASNIFRKEDGEWKMIAHHTDLLPFLE